MKLATAAAKKLRLKCVEKYAEIATLGTSAPVSVTQLTEAATVIDKPISKEDERTVLDTAAQRKTRAELRDYARKQKTGSQVSPDTKSVLQALNAAYRKPWSRKSAVMLEVLLENRKLVVEEPAEQKPAAKKPAAKKSTAAKKTTARKSTATKRTVKKTAAKK